MTGPTLIGSRADVRLYAGGHLKTRGHIDGLGLGIRGFSLIARVA
jgi:hypothetical protein